MTLMLSREEAFTPDEESRALESSEGRARYGELVGRSPAMRRVFGLLSRLESSLVNVLVEGESEPAKSWLLGRFTITRAPRRGPSWP